MHESDLIEAYHQGRRDFRGLDLRGLQAGHVDLAGIDLRGANLAGAYFFAVGLRGANLSDANLERANLQCGVFDDAALCRIHGVNARLHGRFHGADLTGADLLKAELSNSNLPGAVLSRARFTGGDLVGCDFTGATLRDADFRSADVRKARLEHVDARGANFSGANLSESSLEGGNFGGCSLVLTILNRADLRGANFDRCTIGGVSLNEVTLSALIRGGVTHTRPSAVDWRTVVNSLGEPGLKDFLRAAGTPDVFAEYMVDCARSLAPWMVFSLLQSTFISYGGPDEPFARKLNEALKHRGVTTFFFKDDAMPGEKLHRTMRNGVNDHDRTILICSEASLAREGLLNELEETLTREARDGGKTYLIPVRLDDFVFAWSPKKSADLAQAVRDRVIADFSNHEDVASFEREVAKLIAVLRRPVA